MTRVRPGWAREPGRPYTAAAVTVQTGTEETIAAAVRAAHVPSLLAALAQTTGDLSLLRDELRPDPVRVREPTGGMSRDQRIAARGLAAEVLATVLPAPPPVLHDRDSIARIL